MTEMDVQFAFSEWSPFRAEGRDSETPLAQSAAALRIDEQIQIRSLTASEQNRAARIIAAMLIAEATHAANVVGSLGAGELSSAPEALCAVAIGQLTVTGATPQEERESRRRRDALLCAMMPWIAASEAAPHKRYLANQLNGQSGKLVDAVMIEVPEGIFGNRAPSGGDQCGDVGGGLESACRRRGSYRRSPELVATAAALIDVAGMDEAARAVAAGGAVEEEFRIFRAGLEGASENPVFADNDCRIGVEQRSDAAKRELLDAIAEKATAYLRKTLEGG